MHEIINPIRGSIIAAPTYEDFRQAFSDYYGRQPCGCEMLDYMCQHPDQQKVEFPNSAWKESYRPKDDIKGARA
jgi:hypothetical protein